MATAAGSALRPQRTQFKNGLVLLHNRAAATPSVVVRALIRAGSSREGASEHGIAGLTGRMLRQGTENIGKAALAEELDGMGAGREVRGVGGWPGGRRRLCAGRHLDQVPERRLQASDGDPERARPPANV